VPVLLVAEGPCCRDVDPIRGFLDITEDWPLCLLLVPLKTDTVLARQDNQVIDLCKRRKLVLEGVVS
jgi:hypothetical protein